MPKEETIELRHIRNTIGEREDLPSLNPRVSMTSRVRSLTTKSFGVPQLIHLYGALGLNKTLTLAAGENLAYAIFSDGTYLYTCLSTSPGMIVKIDLSTFTSVSTLTLATGENGVFSTFSDGIYLYAGLLTTPGMIVKIDLNTFTKLSTLTLATGENTLSYLFSDGINLYGILLTTPGMMVKIDLATFKKVNTITFAVGEDSTIGIFSDGTYLYISSLTAPGKIIRRYIIPSSDLHQRKIDIIKDSVQSEISSTTSNGNVGGTTLIDTSRTEADNYWNNMTILILGGASKGQSRKISSFSNATNTITVSSAFSTQILSGQKYVILPYIASTATSTLTQADILSDATPFAGANIASIKAKTDLIPADIVTQLDTNIPNINTNTDPKVSGKLQVFTKTITSAANAGAVTIGTITTQPCVIESIIIHANAAQTADLTSCPITGAAGVISFIDATVATQANLNATDKEVAIVYGSAGVSLKATKTLVITLNGTGATTVNLDVIINYRATVSGGYIL